MGARGSVAPCPARPRSPAVWKTRRRAPCARDLAPAPLPARGAAPVRAARPLRSPRKAMRILLTGAAGQVGSDLVPALVARGHHVTAFDIAKAPPTPIE